MAHTRLAKSDDGSPDHPRLVRHESGSWPTWSDEACLEDWIELYSSRAPRDNQVVNSFSTCHSLNGW